MRLNKINIQPHKNINFKKLDVKVDAYKNWNPMALNEVVKNTEIQNLATKLSSEKKDLLVEYDEYRSPLDATYNYLIILNSNKNSPYRISDNSIKGLCEKIQKFQSSDFVNGNGSGDRSCIRDFCKAKLLEEESYKILKAFNKDLKSSAEKENISEKIKNIFK